MSDEESPEQFHRRLLRVIAQAETTFHESDFFWRPLAQQRPPDPEALACVRDVDVWHEFVPAGPGDPRDGRFRVVCFRFGMETSAIGFVAWLHSHLRDRGKTGAIVICGKDRRESEALFQVCQGAMDYWACPVGPAGERFLTVIRDLIAEGQVLPTA